MKKIGLGLLGVIAVAAIYYFTAGSAQLTQEMKAQLNSELSTLQTQGFTVENRKIEEQKEHFILSLDNPNKVATFLNTQGAQLNPEDIEVLKGFKLGVDVHYMANAYSAVSLDMYPVALPDATKASALTDSDKKVLKHIENMMEKKALLLHVDINKLATGFKGYMKDINEVFEGESKLTLTLKKLNFDGDITNDKLNAIHQTLNELRMKADNELDMHLNGVESHYKITGKTNYDYTTDYSIKDITISVPSEFMLLIQKTTATTTSTTKNGLVSVRMESDAEKLILNNDGQKLNFKKMAFDMKVDNLDIEAIKGLEQAQSKTEAEISALLQQLISKAVHIEMPTFAIADIDYNDQKLKGFEMNAKLDIDKSLNLATLEQNPMAAVSAIDANLNLMLSTELFGILAQQPQAMMAMMLFQPKDVNGKKVYKVELKNGSVKVNGQPIM